MSSAVITASCVVAAVGHPGVDQRHCLVNLERISSLLGKTGRTIIESRVNVHLGITSKLGLDRLLQLYSKLADSTSASVAAIPSDADGMQCYGIGMQLMSVDS